MLGGHDGLLQLVGALHAGAASSDSWSDALDMLSDRMGGSRLLLGTTPHAAGRFELAGHRIDPALLTLINGPLATREANPVFGAVPRAPIHRPVIISQRLQARKLRKSPVYAQVMQPSGIAYSMVVVLEADPVQALTLAIGRGAGPGDYRSDEATLLALLAPHLSSAIKVRQELALARAGHHALDALDRGIMLVSECGAILFANIEAERILSKQDGLSGRCGVLGAARSGDNDALRRLIAGAARAAAGRSSESGGVTTVARPSGRPNYFIAVRPAAFPRTDQLWASDTPASAAVFIRDPERRSTPPAELLRTLYGLTRVEALLALQLYEGISLVEAADRLGISINTAKTHLKVTFDKMDVSRQSALVRQVALMVGDLANWPG